MRCSNSNQIEIQVAPSRLVLTLQITLFAAVMLCTLLSKMNVWLHLIVICFFTLYFTWLLRLQGWWPLQSNLFSLRHVDDGWLYTRANKTEYFELLRSEKLTLFALFVSAKSSSGKTLHFAIWRDSLPEANFKALYTALKFGRFEQAIPKAFEL